MTFPPASSKINNMNKNDLITQEKLILQQIYMDELEVGDTIPSVRELQSRLCLSRNSVLTAIQSLNEKGIIKKGMSPRQGYRLCEKPIGVNSKYNRGQELSVQYLLPFTTWNYTINKYLSNFESIFSRHGINLIFSNTHNSVEEEGRLLETIYSKPASLRPDFLFLTTCDSTENPNLAMLQKMNEELPCILIDRYFHGRNFHYIGVSNNYIGSRTAEYLLQNGHEHIAYIKAYGKISTIHDRFSSFQTALDLSSIPLEKQNIFSLTNANVGSIADIQGEIDRIGAKILSLTPRPTAVVCSFDRIAVALINFFVKNSVRVPKDICVIGCDNDVDVGAMSPLSLTTFRHPYRECAREAIARMEAVKNNQKAPPHAVEFFSDFIIGEST